MVVLGLWPATLPAQSGVLPERARPGAVTPRPERFPPVPASIDAPRVDIPPAYERPLGVDDGERIRIRRFIVTGLEENPKLGLYHAEVEQLVEQLRLQVMGLDKVNAKGFTAEEQQLIDEFLETAARDLRGRPRTAEYEALLSRLRYQRYLRSGLTIGQMQNIANKLTEFYRAKGFFLAQALIPEQVVNDESVEIRVLEGKLGQVLVEGNKDYRLEVVRSPFADIIGKPVNKRQVEQALLSVSDYPGLESFGVFSRGRNLGETDLTLRVQNEDRHEFTAHSDTHGTDSTGEQRLRFSYLFNNTFRNGDLLEAQLLQTASPANSTYGSLEYGTPVFSHGYMAGGGFSSNAFDIGGELAVFSLSGETRESWLYTRKQLARGRSFNAYADIRYADRLAETLQADSVVNRDKLQALTLELGFDSIDSVAGGGLNQGVVQYTRGSVEVPAEDSDVLLSRPEGSESYAKTVFILTRLQTVTGNQSLLLRYSRQLSSDLLTSLEQASLGGSDDVRGYQVAEFLRDDSQFASLEYIFNAPFFAGRRFSDTMTWGQVLQVSLFADFSSGKLNVPASSEIELTADAVDLSAYGLAVQFNLPGTVFSKLEIGKRGSKDKLGETFTEDDIAALDETQVFFELEYYF
jgi:hemolysin activation/secretion protein